MIKTVKRHSKRILIICGLAAILLTPNFATPSYACGGASAGAGHCSG